MLKAICAFSQWVRALQKSGNADREATLPILLPILDCHYSFFTRLEDIRICGGRVW
jgi:hypothetical protein